MLEHVILELFLDNKHTSIILDVTKTTFKITTVCVTLIKNETNANLAPEKVIELVTKFCPCVCCWVSERTIHAQFILRIDVIRSRMGEREKV